MALATCSTLTQFCLELINIGNIVVRGTSLLYHFGYALVSVYLETRLMTRVLIIAVVAALFSVSPFHSKAQHSSDDTDVRSLARSVLSGNYHQSREALNSLVARGQMDIVSSLILALRYRSEHEYIADGISKLTGETIRTWNEAMLWQEAHPEVISHESYYELKVSVFKYIDENFLKFLGNGRGENRNMDIRLEEITWGGVEVDGIPSLDNPAMVSADQADYLKDTDLVFGVAINGDVRAYPLRIMGWHEMFNETIGGVPVALAYCTLCGAGILFETQIEGRDQPLIFGSSGFLYRSNKLMFDRQTNSLWNQFTGEPVNGPLRGKGIKLKIRPVVITSWEKWKSRNPTTKVLSIDTGFYRDYGSGVVYQSYFSSPDLMFPALVRNEDIVQRKDYVFGIRDFGVARAWPLKAFEKEPVINDIIGDKKIVLIGDINAREVRAYIRNDREFRPGSSASNIASGAETWEITETALVGPSGETLGRIPGHISYWFAWDGYLGVESTLYVRK